MKSQPTPWNEKALLICTKCAQRERSIDSLSVWPQDWAEQQKNKLKTQLKNVNKAKDIRVMTCSCLGFCPKDEQVVLVHHKNFPTESPAAQKENSYVELVVGDVAKEPQFLENLVKSFSSVAD